MAYSSSDLLNGQSVINSFLKMYLKYNGVSIDQDVLLGQVFNYDHTKALQILGNQFELTLERNYELLDNSMDNLALQTKGGVPTSQGFLDALKANYSEYSYIKKALSDAGSEAVGIATDFGKGSLSVVTTISKYLPLIIFGYLGLLAYSNRKVLGLDGIFKK